MSVPPKLVVEAGPDGNQYKYYRVGKYVVIAPGVCGGRPTFKGSRIEVQVILDLIQAGASIAEILEDYPMLTREALAEALGLAAKAFQEHYALKAA